MLFNLGDKVKHKFSNYYGTVTGIANYLGAATVYQVTVPEVNESGEVGICGLNVECLRLGLWCEIDSCDLL